ncbi:glycosyltransferase family 18 protein [Mixia osmundae IAM 14324]|uniref:alpha-1,6-mannosyl-glycoprotein 6-beta-N-acetylglucosaminyltransferase n=1 Tax=Mixia osmundae (strain CBS 9802 / IAM 14324 / JCM 22182 / KY 12970) TaxID=764103 RepID=G7E5M7_MIXOS|nr:glycosyltransferase family 18 protein [Mixia osmundae IAM 14324]KEI40714.1 glycosyltransferase family 18 protein [Mixia osmundae IAM 14324]GAA98137.1 hypothetical protein E5Q_04820 [Mixia osmundae IAM 14324]
MTVHHSDKYTAMNISHRGSITYRQPSVSLDSPGDGTRRISIPPVNLMGSASDSRSPGAGLLTPDSARANHRGRMSASDGSPESSSYFLRRPSLARRRSSRSRDRRSSSTSPFGIGRVTAAVNFLSSNPLKHNVARRRLLALCTVAFFVWYVGSGSTLASSKDYIIEVSTARAVEMMSHGYFNSTNARGLYEDPAAPKLIAANPPSALPSERISRLLANADNSQSNEPSQLTWSLARAILPPLDEELLPWHTERIDTLARLIHCKLMGTCTEKQKKIVLVGAGRFQWCFDGTFDRPSSFANGEAILAQSFIWALKEQGYPMIFVDEKRRTRRDVIRAVARLHEVLNDHVKMVVFDYQTEPECIVDRFCAKSAKLPRGIPRWKMFVWDGLGGVMGYETATRWPWHLVGVPLARAPESTFLGHTIEKDCANLPFVAHQDRPHAAYMLGKDSSYYEPSRSSWTHDDLSAVVASSGLELRAGIKVTRDNHVLPPAIKNIGVSTRTDFITSLGTAKVLIGVGNPIESPSPFEALCMGTPFINPGSKTNHALNYEGIARTHDNWRAQHAQLLEFGAPYVYNVEAHNQTELLAAVQQALATPLKGPFIPKELSNKGYIERLESAMAVDYEALYIDINGGSEDVERQRVIDFAHKQGWPVNL